MATFVVNTTANVNDSGDGLMSIQEALSAANANPGADTVTFAASLKGQQIHLFNATGNSESLVVAGNVTINGDIDDDGIADIVISGDNKLNHLSVAAGADVTIIGVDFINGRSDPTQVGFNGGQGLSGDHVGDLGLAHDGAKGPDGNPGQRGSDGGHGAQAYGSIYNLGTLHLVRVGFGSNGATGTQGGAGGRGGDGSSGGDGNFGINGAENTLVAPRNESVTIGYKDPSEQNPDGVPFTRTPSEQNEVANADFVLPIRSDFPDFDHPPAAIFNTSPRDTMGGAGGAGGRGGDGGDGGAGGDGGDAAGAILNGVGATLTLTDVAFGGRVASGLITGGNFANASRGGVGGLGGGAGAGGTGGEGGTGGQHWTELFPYTVKYFRNGQFVGAEGVVTTYIQGNEGGVGGNGGAGGNEGDDGASGNGGNAGSVVNQGLISGLAALGGIAIVNGGSGGAAVPGLNRNGLGGGSQIGGDQVLNEYGRPVDQSNSDPHVFTPREAIDRGDAIHTNANHGQQGANGVLGDNGTAGAPGLSVMGILSDLGGDQTGAATTDVLVFLHALPRADAAAPIVFNIVRLGSYTGTVTVNWDIIGTGVHPVDGSDFAGGQLPTGSVTLDSSTAFAQVEVDLAPSLHPGTTESYRIALDGASITGSSNAVALGTHVAFGDTDGGALVLHALNDFNGDGKSDLLFQANGGIFQRQMDDRTVGTQGPVGPHDPAFSVQVIGDFDGDGKSDVAFHNPSTGGVYAWLLDGATIKSQGAVDVADPAYHLLGTGDLNGDGKADLIFRNDAGTLYEWQMDGLDNTPMAIGPLSPDWRVQGAGDFDGDGKADLLLRDLSGNAGEGAYYLWEMNGNVIKAEGGIDHTPTAWVTLGTGDFDGDGKTDVALRNQGGGVSDGVVWIWLMNGTTIASQGAAGFAKASDFDVAGIGDYNGDGKDDILFRNETGSLYSWDMNGTHIASEGAVPWASPDQHIVGQHWELV